MISTNDEMEIFVHCSLCVDEVPSDMSPREYAQLEVGFTKIGIQVWCKRHEVNVLHIDFEGQKHPACIDMAKDSYRSVN